ncbi:MAG: tripartite tricarboxylate transporter permease, partial [Egibacteraceae bacterium]
DSVYGTVRFDFGIVILRDGVNYLAVMIGVYALGECIKRFAEEFAGQVVQQPGDVRTTIPGLRALWQRSGSFARGIATGTFMGAVPGAGATVGSFVAYGLERQFGRYRNDVGDASPNGVVAPQAASTATVAGALIPLLTLGIPGSAASAVILGALLLHDVQPGPRIFVEQPDLIATIFASLLLGLVLMFAVGVLGAKPLMGVMRVREVYISAFVVLFAFIGAFALRQSMSDVWIMIGFAILGLFMTRYDYPLAPLVLGAILGPLAERYFVTTLISSAGDYSVFLTRPLSGTLAAVWAAMVAGLTWKAYRRSREGAAVTQPAGSGDM